MRDRETENSNLKTIIGAAEPLAERLCSAFERKQRIYVPVVVR